MSFDGSNNGILFAQSACPPQCGGVFDVSVLGSSMHAVHQSSNAARQQRGPESGNTWCQRVGGNRYPVVIITCVHYLGPPVPSTS